jgi:general secretion pathway protein A
MLSNLETPQSKLLQIVLVGQPELDAKLHRPELRQLRQRVELRHRLRPLTRDETSEYVRERLVLAGHETGRLFTSASLRTVYYYSRGIPRVVNVLCDNSLLTAFAREFPRISARVVDEAAREIGLGDWDPLQASAETVPADRGGWLRRLLGRPRVNGNPRI